MTNDPISQAFALHQAGHLQQAISLYEQICRTQPKNTEARHLMGLAFFGLRRIQEAIREIEQCIAINPSFAPAWSNLAMIYNEIARFDEARKRAENALRIEPKLASARNNLANALRGLGQPQAAKTIYETLAADFGINDELRFNIAITDLDLGNLTDAVSALELVLDRLGSHAKVLEALARAHVLCRAPHKAKPLLAALRNSPEYLGESAFLLSGVIAYEEANFQEAETFLKEAARRAPGNGSVWINLGIAYNARQQFTSALQALSNAYRIDPNQPFLMGRLAHQKMECADWSGLDDLIQTLEQHHKREQAVAEPFGYQAIARTPEALFECAKRFFDLTFKPTEKIPPAKSASPGQSKFRLGFLSGEFRNHATLILLIGVLEEINALGHTVICFDNGLADASIVRKRLEAFATIISIRNLSDFAAAAAIKAQKVDILFDLNVFFGRYRPEIFLQRPAPIQINYLGFPGTSCNPAIDFIIADSVVLPKTEEKFYSETVLRLANTYQPNDARRNRPAACPRPKELSLDLKPFVFCCFNNTYKITPQLFNVWCNILKRTPNSVLWLLNIEESISKNLQNEALLRDLAPGRLIFSPRVVPEEHLARHLYADLVLDTSPYNAHTTASDALWMGVPVLTVRGTTFPGRVAESLLRAADLDQDLVAENLNDYENMAVEFAASKTLLNELKEKLLRNRMTTPLFDSAQYALQFITLLKSV